MKTIHYFPLALVCLLQSIYGQSTQNSLDFTVLPPAPDMANLVELIDHDVNKQTGALSIPLPLHTLLGDKLDVPISLNYDGTGVKLHEYASQVGLKWNLVAGGMITRSVRGLPDDQPNGYFNQGNYNIASAGIAFPPSTGATVTASSVQLTPAQENLLEQLAAGSIDGEPDSWTAVLPGSQEGSIQFAFDINGNPHPIPYGNQYIDFDQNNSTFTIITESSNKESITYRFGLSPTSKEYTYSTPASGSHNTVNQYISTWRLDQIITQGDTATITYLNNSPHANGRLRIAEKSRSQTLYSTDPFCGVKAPQNSLSTITHLPTQIDAITTSRGSARFIYGARQDYNMENTLRLDTIKIYDIDNRPIKNILFTYALYGPFGGKRMFLTAVQTTSGYASKSIPKTTFEYHTQGFPSNKTPSAAEFAEDHWGYYNGQTSNTGMIPRKIYGEYGQMGNAIKEAQFPAAQLGTLKKMTNPTGAFWEFDFELNAYYLPSNEAFEYQPQTIESQAMRIGGPGVYDRDTFRINANDTVVCELITAIINPTATGNDCPSDVTLRNVQDGSIVRGLQLGYNLPAAPQSYTGCQQTSAQFRLPGGDYYLEAFSGAVNDNVIGTLTYMEEVTLTGRQRNKKGGGLRIGEIRMYDGINATPSTTTYDYRDTLDRTRSSGVLNYKLVYQDIIHDVSGLIGCQHLAIYSSNRASGSGSPVDYHTVTVNHGGAGAPNGKTISHYTTALDYPDGAGASTFPFGSSTSWKNRRRQLIKETIVDATGKKVSSIQKTINLRNENRTDIPIYKAGLLLGGNNAGSNINVYTLKKVFVPSYWQHPIETKERTYADDGVNYIEKTTTTTYGNPAHIQPTEITTGNSDGSISKTFLYYPRDFNNGVPSTSTNPVDVALNKMMLSDQLNNQSAVIEAYTATKQPGSNEFNFVQGIFKQYTVDPVHNLVVPSKVYSSVLNENAHFGLPLGPNAIFSRLKTSSSVANLPSYFEAIQTAEHYDAKGRLVTVSSKDDKPISYYYCKGNLIAQAPLCERGTLPGSTHDLDGGDAGFLNFESAQDINYNIENDNWIFDPNPANVHSNKQNGGVAHTGNYSRAVQSTGPARILLPSERHQNAKYLLSAWVYLPAGFTSGQLVIHTMSNTNNTAVFPANTARIKTFTPNTIGVGQWKRIQIAIDLAAVRSNAGIAPNVPLRVRGYITNNYPNSGTPLYVDDMMIHPNNAPITTYAHDPGFGITNIMDTRGKSTSFEYDPLGRLSVTRDFEGNLIKTIDYNYKTP